MAADGSHVRQVTSIGGYSGQTSWSPAGDLIAFTSDGADYPSRQGIYVVAPDGTGLRRVFALPLGAPDGTHVAFTLYRGGKDTPHGIRTEVSTLWVVDLDDTHARQLGPWGLHVGDADSWASVAFAGTAAAVRHSASKPASTLSGRRTAP